MSVIDQLGGKVICFIYLTMVPIGSRNEAYQQDLHVDRWFTWATAILIRALRWNSQLMSTENDRKTLRYVAYSYFEETGEQLPLNQQEIEVRLAIAEYVIQRVAGTKAGQEIFDGLIKHFDNCYPHLAACPLPNLPQAHLK